MTTEKSTSYVTGLERAARYGMFGSSFAGSAAPASSARKHAAATRAMNRGFTTSNEHVFMLRFSSGPGSDTRAKEHGTMLALIGWLLGSVLLANCVALRR